MMHAHAGFSAREDSQMVPLLITSYRGDANVHTSHQHVFHKNKASIPTPVSISLCRFCGRLQYWKTNTRLWWLQIHRRYLTYDMSHFMAIHVRLEHECKKGKDTLTTPIYAFPYSILQIQGDIFQQWLDEKSVIQAAGLLDATGMHMYQHVTEMHS